MGVVLCKIRRECGSMFVVRCRGFVHLQNSDVKRTGCDTGTRQRFPLGRTQ